MAASPPPRQREELAARAERDGALPHPRRGGERLLGAVEDAVLVHLVRHGQQVMLDADRRQLLEPARTLIAWILWKTQARHLR